MLTTHKVKCPRKKKKTGGPSDSVSADEQAQGLEKPPQGQARKRKALIKSEKTRIVLSLRDLSVNDILSHVVSEVSSLCNIKSNSNKAKFWDAFKASRELLLCAFVCHLQVVLHASPSYVKERERVWSKGSHFHVPTLKIVRGQSDHRNVVTWLCWNVHGSNRTLYSLFMKDSTCIDRKMVKLEAILVAIKEASESLGVSKLKDEQKDALVAFASGRNVFMSLPTGFSKSLCYSCLPGAFARLRNTACSSDS